MSANTPRLTFPTQTRGRAAGSHDTGFSFAPELVLGSTVSTVNALSAAVDASSFAFCAGSTVVLAVITLELGLDQRLFCIKPDALPAQATPSYYNPATPTKATGTRGYTNSSSKDDLISGTVSLASADHSADSPGRLKSAHRSRNLTCVALSPSGRFLAAGEIGYRPRILIFSTASNAPTDVPLACLTEHTFGVRALAFSPDSRWLCSLGDSHDGGLFLWSINPKTGALRLDSSNRCTAAGTVAWMGTSVVSVGTRHVKIWRLEQPSSPSKGRRGLDSVHDRSTASPVPKTLAGRNCLLGPLKDAIFTCVVGISEDRAILGTQDGTICLLEDANRTQTLYQISKKDYCIGCVTVDHSSGTVWLGGEASEPEALPLDVFLTANNPSVSLETHVEVIRESENKTEDCHRALAICCVNNRLVAIDSSRVMRIYDVASTLGDNPKISHIQQLPAHDGPVLGVVILSKPNRTQSDFLTYSERGDVFSWLWNGTCTSHCSVPLDHPFTLGTEEFNELRVVLATSTGSTLLAGDKAGLVHLLNAKGEAKAVIKAHDGEVNDLALYEPDKQNSYAASCGRDRTIQVFRISNDEYSLQQSLINEHAGPIRKLEFADNGSVLASMSPDRTIVIHRKVLKTDSSIAFVSTKVISLKATPLTMTLLPEAMPALLVSATDRCIHKVSIAEGHVTQTIKTTDNTNAEPGVISRLSVGDLVQQSNKPSVIAGFSLADRSVRLYDVETGSLLVTEFGQTAVSDLALAEAPGPSGEIVTKVISTGLDGTIMIWSISTPSQKSGLRQDAGDGSYQNDPLKILPTSGPRPLRRVLSKIEIAQHQKTLVKLERVAPTASTNLSPSRLHRSTSKFTIADTPEVFDPSQSDKDCYSHAFAFGSFHRKGTKLAHPRLSPKSNTQSRFRRSSLDERHRDIVAHCNRDINTTGQQLLDVLQGFRKELVTSKESLSVNTRQALQRELHSTLENLTQQSRRNDPNDGEIGNESFDDSLARMIDDRLALRFKCEDQANSTEGGRDTNVLPAKSNTDTTG